MMIPSPTPPLACLGRRGSDRIGLAVAGYQFPGLTAPQPQPDDWDRNWLLIRGEVECARGRWAFEDPCLITWKLAELLDWLAAMPDPPAPALHFTEPLLAFAAAERGAGGGQRRQPPPPPPQRRGLSAPPRS